MSILKTIDKAIANLSSVAILPAVAISSSAQGVFHFIGEWADNNRFRGAASSLEVLNNIAATVAAGSKEKGYVGYITSEEYMAIVMDFTPKYTAAILQIMEGCDNKDKDKTLNELKEAYGVIGSTMAGDSAPEAHVH